MGKKDDDREAVANQIRLEVEVVRGSADATREKDQAQIAAEEAMRHGRR